MPTYKIPNSLGQVRQLNINDVAGELWSSKNIDLFSNPGKIKLARPFTQVMTDSDLSGDQPVGFGVLNNDVYVLTTNNLYSDQSPFNAFTVASSSPSNAQDMTLFKGQLVISNLNDIDAYDGSNFTNDWWTARGNPSLRTGSGNVYPHIMEVLRIGTETLCVTDGQEVHSYVGGISSSPVISSSVDIGQSFVATCIKGSIRSAWIGSFTEDVDQAYVFQWDGTSTNYTESYPVGAKAVLAMELVDDVPMIVTERGEIKKFNNVGFTTVARFPFALKPLFADGVETGLIQRNNLSRPIHPKGMKRYGNTVFIYVAFEPADGSDGTIDNRTHCGLWALDLDTYSLTHVASPNNHFRLSNSSPIMVFNEKTGRIFMGGTLTNGDRGVWFEDLNDDSINEGYVVTSEIDASAVQDVYEQVIAKASLGEDDTVTVKFRTEADTAYPITTEVTWAGVNENQFTSTDALLSHVKERYDAKKRDEIEILILASYFGSFRQPDLAHLEKRQSHLAHLLGLPI